VNRAERRTPSFTGLRPGSDASSRAKRANKRSGTQPELLLGQALRRLGVRFKRNVASLPGCPDFVFDEARIVVLSDGDFWHGREWRSLRRKLALRHNSAYWIAKIKANRGRDRRQTRTLQAAGWTVIRVWESEIRKEAGAVANRILRAVSRRADLRSYIRG
jgi:DNA mismatch endonuclease (patch repair protein)